MSYLDSCRWNTCYASNIDFWMQCAPRALLRDHAGLLPKRGLALDAAAGVAANGLFLLEHGLRVIALDVSEFALRKGVNRARERRLPLQAAVCDFTQLWLPADYFDVIVNFLFLERSALPVYKRALKPGGALFFETLLNAGAQGSCPKYYLKRAELCMAFADYEVLHSARGSGSEGEKTTEQLIARKPLAY